MHRGQEQWQVNPLSVMLSYVNCSVPKLSCKDWVLWVPRQMQLWTEIILGVRDHVWSLTRKGEQTAEVTQLRPTPSLNSTAPCEATFQSRSLLGWASEWREGQSCPGWTVRCEPQSHLRQEAGSEEEQLAIVSTGQRGAMCLLPSLSFSFRNTSLLWYRAHMYVQTPTQTRWHMQRHQSTYT